MKKILILFIPLYFILLTNTLFKNLLYKNIPNIPPIDSHIAILSILYGFINNKINIVIAKLL